MGIGEAMLGSSLLGAGGSIFGGLTQAGAAKGATAAEMSMFQQAKDLASPFIKFGKGALSPLSKLITPGADQTKTLEQTPGYQFAFNQGEKGVTNQATMGGLGGNVMRAGGQFAAGLAQNTWGDVVSKLMDAARIGSSSASNVGGMATTVGGQIGSNIMGGANALAGGAMGAAGALGGGLQNLGMLSWLQKYMGKGNSAPGMYPGGDPTAGSE